MRVGDALIEAAKKDLPRLQALKRDQKTRDTALRLEEHVHGRASNVKSNKGGKKR